MRFVVFSGTADGRELCEWLSGRGVPVVACVATEYGAEMMKTCAVHTGRMDEDGMRGFLKKDDIVIDATHPYADKVSENIYSVCSEKKITYLRLLRGEMSCDGAVYVKSAAAAAEYLKGKDGRVFVSTGSKELGEFSCIGERVTARVLDTPAVREKCGALGIKNVLYKTPPFSYEVDLRDMEGCRYLVTKDGGKTGGMPEKLRAAETLGMETIIVSRPKERNGGYGYEEIKHRLKKLIGEEDLWKS